MPNPARPDSPRVSLWHPLQGPAPEVRPDTLYVLSGDLDDIPQDFFDSFNEVRRRPASLVVTDRGLLSELKLRLDSLVYVCEEGLGEDGDGLLTLTEAYAVKDGERLFNKLGEWNVEEKLFEPASNQVGAYVF